MIIAVIADDFTGANDNGALLAAKGFSSATCLGLAHWNPREFTQCDAVCLNAESRLLHRQEAWKAVYDAVRAFNLEKPALVSKRIDSTLRGNVGAELEAVIKSMDDSHGHNETLAVMVSSYPHSGRICVGGYQIVHGVQKWVHFFGPVNGKTKVDSFIGYAAHLGLIRGGTPSGLYC